MFDNTKTFSFQRVPYDELNSRQQENFNFQKISARLADFGFTPIWLSDDWNGADFLALDLHGKTPRDLHEEVPGRGPVDLLPERREKEERLRTGRSPLPSFLAYPLVGPGSFSIRSKNSGRSWRLER